MALIQAALDVKNSLNSSGGVRILTQSGIGWIVASLASANAATYSQTTTTITVTSTGHTLTATHNGKRIYLAIASGLATAGWYTNFTYVDANTFTCTSAVSQSTSGTVNTNTTATTITELSTVLPGGTMGANGILEVRTLATMTGSTNAKTVNSLLGSSNIKNLAHSGATVVSSAERRLVANANNQAKQIMTNLNLYDNVGGMTSANTVLTINTAIDQTISHKLTCAAANEFCIMEHVMVVVYPFD